MQMAQKLDGEVTLDEVNCSARDLITDKNQVCVLYGPDKEGVALPTEAQIEETILKAQQQTYEAYKEQKLADQILDAKQRGKMTEEFYIAVKKEIAEYQEKADYLIKSGSRSPSTLERWVVKIAGLEEKKRHYEEILRRELDGLDDEFGNLKLLAQEMALRARGLRAKKAA